MIKLNGFLGGNMSKKDNNINDVSNYLKELEDKISATKGKNSGAANLSPDEMRLLKAVQSAQKNYESMDDVPRAASRRSRTKSKSQNKPSKKLFGKSNKENSTKESKTKKKASAKTGSLKEKLIFLFTKENEHYNPKAGNFIEKNGKKIKNKKRLVSPIKTIRNIIVVGLVFILLFTIYAGTVIATAPKIDPANIYEEISRSSIIYDDKGNEYDYFSTSEKRTLVEYKEIPKNTVNAFVALEDKTFWKHHGLNYKRLIGATLGIFRSGSISGTSTITQQLARNVYLPNIKSQRSIKRKILEVHYAKKIENNLSKEKIIEAYLNSIYFGFGNYGIEGAAKTYFSKDVSDLTLEESAALASLPQSPDAYSLIKNYDGASYDSKTASIIKVGSNNYLCNDISAGRRNICLKLMLDQGYIKQAQYESAHNKALKDFINPDLSSYDDASADYFKDYLSTQIISDLVDKYKMSKEEAARLVYGGGLKIYSTIDKQAQSVITKEFSNNANFPSSITSSKDSSGNIKDEKGNIALFSYKSMFNSNDEFVFDSDECQLNNNGTLTIFPGKRLNIYKTNTANGKDYSLEFKPIYYEEGSNLYIYHGGYINIPQDFKKLDKNGNLIIAKEYLAQKDSIISISKNEVKISNSGYTLQQQTIQPQAAMVINEVGTGHVKAMVGGRGISGEKAYNRAINPRQPGSTIKPIAIYSSAIQNSYELHKKGQKFKARNFGNDKQGSKYYGNYLTESSIILDEPITINGRIWPHNFDKRFHGKMNMKQAIEQSTNITPVKIYEQLGADYCMQTAKKFGLSNLVTSGETSDMGPAALALGGLTKGVTPLEMTEAYSTFPGGGERQDALAYTRVIDSNGKEILKTKTKSTKVLDEGVAFVMKDMLQSVVTRGIGGQAAVSGEAVGGKTGTTDENYDFWFCGFTAKYVSSLWIGNDINIYLNGTSNYASALWGKIFRQLDGAKGGKYPAMPSNVVRYEGNYFIKGTEAKSEKTDEELKKEEEEEQKKLEEEAKKKAEEEARRLEEERKKLEKENNENNGKNQDNNNNAHPDLNAPEVDNGRPREGN